MIELHLAIIGETEKLCVCVCVCLGSVGGGKRKRQGPGASGCHHAPIGFWVVTRDLGPAPLAVQDGP